MVRALVPFAAVLAESTFDTPDEKERTMISAAKHLNNCYKHLSSDEFNGPVLKENAIKFAGSYIALSQTSTDEKLRRVKPKMHLFLELCDGSVEPSKIWTYRDEDFGGSVAALSRRRGGMLSVSAFSSGLLARFKGDQPMIRILFGVVVDVS